MLLRDPDIFACFQETMNIVYKGSRSSGSRTYLCSRAFMTGLGKIIAVDKCNMFVVVTWRFS